MSMKKNNALVGVFFVLLFFGLFLGDGKQWAMDVYGATLAIVVSIYGLIVRVGAAKKLPRSVSYAWVLVSVAVFVSTVYSDSLGYSFSWIVRFLSGFLLYRVFYSLSVPDIEKDFVYGLCVFVGVSALLFVGVYVFPSYITLPSMSLLGTGYGHSHFAELLVLVVPIAIGYLATKSSIISVLAAFLYVVLLYMTRSRGAALIVCGYALFFLYSARNLYTHKHISKLLTVVLCGYVIASVVFVLLPQAKFARFIKSDPVTNRVIYWQQAIDVFMDRPMTGSGPGTFSVSSIQKQRTPWVSSWFAHSAPIQILSELGLLGLVAFGWLFVVHVRLLSINKVRSVGSYRGMLIASMTLLLLYSCFEFVLDYFVIWMLFWATLGLLSGAGSLSKSNKPERVDLIVIGLLGMFYILWVSSFLVTLTVKRADIAFYLAPFDSVQALMFLEQKSSLQPKQSDVWLINVFHKKNPVILDAISKLKERQGDDTKAIEYAKKAAFASPQNTEYYSRYFSLLALRGDVGLLGNEILSISQVALPTKYKKQILELKPYAKGFGQYYKDWMIPERATFANGYASMFYRLGIADLRDVEPTERLLVLARDIYPDLAYLHVELAAFYEHVRKNHTKAQEVLIACQQYQSAAQQCKEQLVLPLYLPSEYKERIL